MDKKDINGVYKRLGASNHVDSIREKDDYYATDPIAADWLLKLEKINNPIWECACGEGHLSKVFENSGYTVKSTDIIDRGYGQGGIDFLNQNEKWNGDIITNPPYKYSEQFVYKALSLINENYKVMMFFKLLFLEGKKRKELFQMYPPIRIWVSSSRIGCAKNGKPEEFKSSAIAYAWFIWEKGYKGDTIIKWFN